MKTIHMKNWEPEDLPLTIDLESKNILKALPSAHFALAELKGVASTIPNQGILVNTLGLQEAKDSSGIENIVTTHDDLYKSGLNLSAKMSLNAKEVQNYTSALKRGFDLISKQEILTNKSILKIQEVLERNNAGFRKVPGTELKNAQTGEIVYNPPQNPDRIVELMSNLEKYINNKDFQDIDPLIKMAVIHFQFESIHPFYDGNGRTGRIINILYLILEKLQSLPILYLSNYIIKHKAEYYNYLQNVRTNNDWETWILFMIRATETTAKETTILIMEMKILMQEVKIIIRKEYSFYSQDLLNNLFRHPYTKIDLVAKDLSVSRLTATKYLNILTEDGILQKKKQGNSNYYINTALVKLLTNR